MSSARGTYVFSDMPQIAGDASGPRLWILLTLRRSVARDQEQSAGSTATEYSWGADIPGGHCTTLNRYDKGEHYTIL